MRSLGSYGATRDVEYTGVEGGVETYKVTFDHGVAAFTLQTAPDGKVALIRWRAVISSSGHHGHG